MFENHFARAENKHVYNPELSPIELEMRFNMERALMYHAVLDAHLSPDDDVEAFLHAWQNEYGREFLEIVDEMRQEDAELLDEWQLHPEIVVKRIEGRLRTRESVAEIKPALKNAA